MSGEEKWEKKNELALLCRRTVNVAVAQRKKKTRTATGTHITKEAESLRATGWVERRALLNRL